MNIVENTTPGKSYSSNRHKDELVQQLSVYTIPDYEPVK